MNTAVDFSVINILITLTGVTAGLQLSFVNAAAFTVAVMHSFFWNKYWAFADVGQKISRFLFQLVSAGFLGFIIILGVIIGASQEYKAVFFIILLVILFLGEVALWKVFKLKTQIVQSGQAKEFSLFLIVSIIGIIINSAVVGLVTGLVDPQFGVNPQLWANMAKVLATVVALMWNFIGYKFIVFKK